jgi:DNA-binding NarL/FixJ family response regulator
LVDLLSAAEGFEVVGHADTLRKALTGIEVTVPEAVTLDISLPDGSGVEVLKHICCHRLETSVVVLTANLYEALRVKCLQLGAMAVLDKINGLAQVRQALLAGHHDRETR